VFQVSLTSSDEVNRVEGWAIWSGILSNTVTGSPATPMALGSSCAANGPLGVRAEPDNLRAYGSD